MRCENSAPHFNDGMSRERDSLINGRAYASRKMPVAHLHPEHYQREGQWVDDGHIPTSMRRRVLQQFFDQDHLGHEDGEIESLHALFLKRMGARRDPSNQTQLESQNGDAVGAREELSDNMSAGHHQDLQYSSATQTKVPQ